MPIVIDKDKKPKVVHGNQYIPIQPKPTESCFEHLVGVPSKILPEQRLPINSSKRVHFDKDILRSKLELFTKVITYFNDLEKQGSNEFAGIANDWVVGKMTDDIFSALHLDRLQWEFNSLEKLDLTKKSGEPNCRDKELERITLKTSVSDFFKKNNPDHIDINLDLDKDLEGLGATETTSKLPVGSKRVRPTGTTRIPPEVRRYNSWIENEEHKLGLRIDYDKLGEQIRLGEKERKQHLSQKAAAKDVSKAFTGVHNLKTAANSKKSSPQSKSNPVIRGISKKAFKKAIKAK